MHSRTIMNIPVLTIVLSLLLVSCNIPSQEPTPTTDANAVFTQAAKTVAVELTKSAALTPSATATQTVTATKPPTQAAATVQAPPAQSANPTNTPASSSGSTTSGDIATFVDDITIPDGTGAAPGSVFDKVWRIKNTGTTTWTSAYHLVYIDGEKMGSPDSTPLPKEVKPGETVDVSIRMTAPSNAGTYQTFFRLRNASGQFFKLDSGGDLWVKIVVGLGATATPGTTETPTVTPTP